MAIKQCIKTGWTLGVGVTSVVLSFATFKLFTRFKYRSEMGVLENNMKHPLFVKIIFAIGLLSFSFSFGSGLENRIGALFEKNPQSSSYLMSNGIKVDLPVHYHQIAALVVLGTVDLEKVSSLMKKTGLQPVPVSSKRGLAIIYMVDHPKNSIGVYKEFVTLIAATSNPKIADAKMSSYKSILSALLPTSGDREARKSDEFFFYVPFISVSTEDALLAGREIWNLPKQMASFDLNFKGKTNSAVLKSPTCNMEFEQSPNHRHLKLPLYMDFSLVGFWNNNYKKIVKAPMYAKGEGYVSFFNESKGDRFQVDESSECGAWINESGFKPMAWQYVPRSGAILYNQDTIANPAPDVLNETEKAATETFTQALQEAFQQ